MSNKLVKEANQMLKFWCLDSKDPDAEYREFIKKYGYPETKEQAKALIEKAKKEGIDPDYIRGLERGLKFWTHDADNSLEERAKKKLAEGGRIQVIAPNGDRCSVVRAGENMVQSWSEKRHQWESFPLSKCKILSVDAEPPIFKMIKELEADIKEHKRMINYMRKYGQNQSADNLEKLLKEEEARLKGYKDIAKLVPSKDNDATENGAIEEFGQNKETEVMPLEKHPVLAQDSQNLKKMAYFRLLVSGDIINTPDGKVEIEKYDSVGFLGRNGKRYKWDDVAVYNKDEDKFGTVMKEFYEGKLKSGSGKTVTDPQQAKAIAYSESKDAEPVYTLEDLEQRLKDLEKEDYIDTFVMGDKPDPKLRKKIEELKKQIKEKKMTKDEKTYQNGEHVKVVNHETGDKIELKVLKDNKDGTMEVKAPTGAVLTIKKAWVVDAYTTPTFFSVIPGKMTKEDLKRRLDFFNNRKNELRAVISKRNTGLGSEGKYYSSKMTPREAEKELADVEQSIKNIESAIKGMTHDECMEVLKLSGITEDAL